MSKLLSTLAVPMLIGGFIRKAVDKALNRDENTPANTDQGILLSSGLIAGEALMGILVAIILFFNREWLDGVRSSVAPGSTVSDILSLIAIFMLAYYLKKVAQTRLN